MKNTIELAWAAGFFDGEGCSLRCKNRNSSSSLRIAIGQTSREELERFQQAVGGIGKINGPYINKNPNASPSFMYQVHGAKAREVFSMIEPFLCSSKKAQFQIVEENCA